MSDRKSVDRLKAKLLSIGCLPIEFAAITAKGIPLNVRWSPLKDYAFDQSADLEMIPFIEVADGTLIALWLSTSPPSIVAIDAHGEAPRIVAKDFPNFLRALSNSQTGVEDIDLDFSNMIIPNYSTLPSRTGVAALEKRLQKWVVAHSSNQSPIRSEKAEAIRKRVHAIAKQMIREGRSNVYKARSVYWAMYFKVSRVKAGFQVTYLDLGKWLSVPDEYDLVPVVEKLIELSKDPKLRKFDVTITKEGIVEVNKGTQLVLIPPGMKLD
jgi:hypothetical protein